MTTSIPYLPLEPEAGTRPQLLRLINQFADVTGGTEQVEAGAPRNAYRASLAATAVLVFAERVGGPDVEPLEQNIRDLLTDLMHLCDLFTEEGFEFGSLVGKAEAPYSDEREGLA